VLMLKGEKLSWDGSIMISSTWKEMEAALAG
jgi:hypothetical protein